MQISITFFSNFLNHHQVPFCNEIYKIIGDRFYFIATEVIHQERLEMGYKDYSHEFPYCINAYESKELYDKALALSYESDIVIHGSAPEIFIKKRIFENKLTFRYSERLFKKGFIRLLDPRVLKDCIFKHTLFRGKNLHMLCASAYTANDVSILYAYPNKCWKWGYFPEIMDYDIDMLINFKPTEFVNILWVGRFLSWKHPEYAVKLAKRLKDKNYKFLLSFIGDGKVKEEIEKMVLNNGLADKVKFLGSMSPEKVRSYMLKANIFLFTSNKQEGWGAVLNEAMNSGCAIVASDAIGSVPFLVKNNISGLYYKNGVIKDLFNKVESLFLNPEKQKSLGKNAYNSVINEWNPKVAAERFIVLSKSLLLGEETIYTSGPCSKSSVLHG